MNVERMLPFMESAGFVLTTDIAVKMLVINDLRAVSSSLILQVCMHACNIIVKLIKVQVACFFVKSCMHAIADALLSRVTRALARRKCCGCSVSWSILTRI